MNRDQRNGGQERRGIVERRPEVSRSTEVGVPGQQTLTEHLPAATEDPSLRFQQACRATRDRIVDLDAALGTKDLPRIAQSEGRVRYMLGEAAALVRRLRPTSSAPGAPDPGEELREIEALAEPVLARVAAIRRAPGVSRDAARHAPASSEADRIATEADDRHAAWRAEAAPLAAKLGVAPTIVADDEARARTDEHGARGLAEGNVIYLHPERVTPGTPDGRHVLIHELVHIAQARGGSPASRADAEAEAEEIAQGSNSDAELAAPRLSLSLDQAAADNGARGSAAKPKDAAPELPPDVPYRWIPGTYATWIRAAWFTGAADFSKDGRMWASPSRVAELLRSLRDHGMLSWVAPDVLQRAARTLGVEGVAGAKVFKVDLGVSVFHEVGLPPGTSALVGRENDGLRVVVAVPGVRVTYGDSLPLSPALADQVIRALEGFTKLTVARELSETIRSGKLTATLGAGTISYPLARATCDSLFGAAAYKTWLEAPLTDRGSASFGAAGGAQSFADLTPEELAYIQRWIRDHLKEGKGKGKEPPTAMSRDLLGVLRRIDAHALKAQILGNVQGGRVAGQLTPVTLDRAIQEAEFESERHKAGLAPHASARPQRDPVFDIPIPFRIDQQNGRVVAGEKVKFTLVIDWPAELDSEVRSEYTWRPKAAEVDWTFERTMPDGSTRTARSHAITHGDHQGIDHSFQLEHGEVAGKWTVTAFVRHDFFRPGVQSTTVEVKTYETRVQETRDQAFADLGKPAIDDNDFDFDTSLLNEAIGSHDKNHGKRFRGDLREGFERRTPEQRTRSLDNEIQRNQQLLDYLRKDHAAPTAILACEHDLAKLKDARGALGNDLKQGWQPFEVRGSFLGRNNQIPDGPLDLHGAVSWIPMIGGIPRVEVQLRDLSRRLAADSYRFRGGGATYEAALEAAFVDLCKRYPGGKVSLLAEGFDPSGKQSTGKTVGFELDTGTAWKDVKEAVFDPAVSVIVNVGSAMLMIFVPATIPVLLPLTIAYNETQTLDQLAQAWDDGTLTPGKGAMMLSQIGLDLMPLLGRAPIFRTTRRTFALFEGFQVGAQALVMTVQARQQIQDIRDQDIQSMARLYEDYVALQRSTHQSDPHLHALEQRLHERAERIRKRSLQVWTDLVKQQAIAFIPVRAATHLEHHATVTRATELAESGRFVHEDAVEPHYDPKRGQIVGDQRKLDLGAVRALTKAQDAHMRTVGSSLATELGVPPDRFHVEVGDETRIWKDGDRIQVRYKPGTDPEAALASWRAEARHARIGTPADAEPRSHAPVPPGSNAHAPKELHGERHSPHRPPAAPTPAVHSFDQLGVEENRVVGHPVPLEQAHDILRALTGGDPTALKQVGLTGAPRMPKEPSTEFGVGKTPDGRAIVVCGEPHAVDWAKVPGVVPAGHTHPSVQANDIRPTNDGNKVSIHDLVRPTPVPLLNRELVFPSADDFILMSRLGIDGHKVFTPYAVIDELVMKAPDHPGPRLEFEIRKPKEVGVLPNGQRVHHATLEGVVGKETVIHKEVWIVQNTKDASGHLHMAEPAGLARTQDAETAATPTSDTVPGRRTRTAADDPPPPVAKPPLEIPSADLSNLRQRVFDHVKTALESIKDAPPDVVDSLTNAGRGAAEHAYREKRGADVATAAARKHAGAAAKHAIKELAFAKAETLARRRAEGAIADGSVFDLSKLPPDAKTQLDHFKAGQSGAVARRMAPTLVGKDMAAMEALLDSELARSSGTKTAQPVSDPVDRTATQIQHVYQFDDGTLIRIKPRGNQFHRGTPMFSIEVKQAPPSDALRAQGGVAFKVNNRGQPVPKGTFEIANPYDRRRYEHQHKIFERTVLDESHQQAATQ